MEYSTFEPRQEISEAGIVYELGSLYERIGRVERSAQGQREAIQSGDIVGADRSGEDCAVKIRQWR